MSLCLTRDELAELTRTPQKRRQIEFLKKNGIRHYVDGDGRPVVTRAAVEGLREVEPPKSKWKPNKAA